MPAKNPQGCRKPVGFSLLWGVGLAIGASFFVRFSNFSILPVAALFVLVGVKNERSDRGRALTLGGVTLISLTALLIFNTVYYDSPLTTSYTPKLG